jgi:hypothetical protein
VITNIQTGRPEKTVINKYIMSLGAVFFEKDA